MRPIEVFYAQMTWTTLLGLYLYNDVIQAKQWLFKPSDIDGMNAFERALRDYIFQLNFSITAFHFGSVRRSGSRFLWNWKLDMSRHILTLRTKKESKNAKVKCFPYVLPLKNERKLSHSTKLGLVIGEIFVSKKFIMKQKKGKMMNLELFFVPREILNCKAEIVFRYLLSLSHRTRKD